MHLWSLINHYLSKLMQKNQKPNQCIYAFMVPNYTLFIKINAKKKKKKIKKMILIVGLDENQ